MKEELQKDIVKLIRLNMDAYEGYKSAAENTNDSLLNTFFNKCALDRKSYAESLGKEINFNDLNKLDTDLKADFHRVWLDIKTADKKIDSKAVLEECARGEKYAIDTYNTVIENAQYPPALQSSIVFQKNDIVSKYDQVQKLKNEFKDNDDQLNRQTPVP